VRDSDPALWTALDAAIGRWEAQWGALHLDSERADLIEEIVAGLRELGLVTND
jgi:hypothetical protein